MSVHYETTKVEDRITKYSYERKRDTREFYMVRINRDGKMISKTFNTIEEARSYADTFPSRVKGNRDGFKYPDVLLEELVGGSFATTNIDIDYIDKHLEDNLLAVLDKAVEPRHADIFWLYYCCGMTLQEIANRYDLSRERVRQIIEFTLKRLKYPNRIHEILYGSKLIDLDAELTKAENMVAGKIVTVEKLGKEIDEKILNKDSKETILKKLENVKVEDLNLSTRPYNALKRNDVDNVRQIIDLGMYGVANLESMGTTSLAEIAGKIKKFGVELR